MKLSKPEKKELQEAVAILNKLRSSDDQKDRSDAIDVLINLAKQYLTLEDKGIFSEKKECECMQPYEICLCGVDTYNQALDEMKLRYLKNMPNWEEIEKITEKHKWTIAKYVMNNKSLNVRESSKTLAKTIHKLYEERLKG